MLIQKRLRNTGVICLAESLNFLPRVLLRLSPAPPIRSFLLLLALLAAFSTADQFSSVQRSLCPRHWGLASATYPDPLSAPVTSPRGSLQPPVSPLPSTAAPHARLHSSARPVLPQTPPRPFSSVALWTLAQPVWCFPFCY